MLLPPPTPTLFPYTTLFRSNPAKGGVSILYEYPSGGTGAFKEADGSHACRHFDEGEFGSVQPVEVVEAEHPLDRKSTRLNSSHMSISYAVFCLKKKKQKNQI